MTVLLVLKKTMTMMTMIVILSNENDNGINGNINEMMTNDVNNEVLKWPVWSDNENNGQWRNDQLTTNVMVMANGVMMMTMKKMTINEMMIW